MVVTARIAQSFSYQRPWDGTHVLVPKGTICEIDQDNNLLHVDGDYLALPQFLNMIECNKPSGDKEAAP